MTIKIASWNVNSINVRLPNIIEWLKETKADVVLFQELKCLEEKFPAVALEDMGYNLAINGQKTYNGVAIASKYPIEDIVYGLPTFKEDSTQARFIQGFTCGINMACVYVPNGAAVDSEKYEYKLKFMECLKQHVKSTLEYDEEFLIAGDFNVARTIWDTHKRKLEATRILTSEKEVRALNSIINTGLIDILRLQHPIVDEFNTELLPGTDSTKSRAITAAENSHLYSWWDYRNNSYTQNLGFRIDYIFTNAKLADKITNTYIDAKPRSLAKASDHTPVVCEVTF